MCKHTGEYSTEVMKEATSTHGCSRVTVSGWGYSFSYTLPRICEHTCAMKRQQWGEERDGRDEQHALLLLAARRCIRFAHAQRVVVAQSHVHTTATVQVVFNGGVTTHRVSIPLTILIVSGSA